MDARPVTSERRARVGDREIRYHDAGDGRPMLLIHGFPFSADQWLPQVSAPPAGIRVIAPDLRGFRGASDAGREPDPGLEGATMASHAADVLALLDHLGLDRAIVGGLSMGGYVALALAMLAPGRLDGLVLADTRATADDEAGRAARDAMIALVSEKGAAAVADAMMPKLLGATSRRERPALESVVRGLVLANSIPAIVSAIRAMKSREDASPWLPQVACPTLIVCGAEDEITPPRDSEAMASLIPSARLVLLPRAGHLSNLEDPGAFTDALRRA